MNRLSIAHRRRLHELIAISSHYAGQFVAADHDPGSSLSLDTAGATSFVA